ncbi:MAG: hypothetical protein IPM51_00340 [Sphingobacteriaceae bacterium]|nr:hypothetical protein [Sphingobacteriaceae bacterium]
MRFFIAQSQSPSLNWAHGIGESNTDLGMSIVTDPSGNVYTTGRFQDTVDFDPGINTFSIVSAGYDDAYVLKLSASGNFIWAIKFGGASFDAGYRIALDGIGNIYVSGIFRGTCDFDPGPGVTNLISNGVSESDVFIVKLDASGNFIWAKNVGSSGSDYAYGLFINQIGDVYVSGNFFNTIDLDPGPAIFTATSNGSEDVFLLKLNSIGDFLWAATFGSTGKDGGSTVACDQFGNVYLSGYFQFTIDFDPGPGTSTLSSVSGWQDIFLIKLDNAGNFIWAKSYGGSGIDNCLSMRIDQLNNIYCTGYFHDIVDFDPGPGIMNLPSAGLQDNYILKLDPSGDFVWVKTYGSIGDDFGTSFV